MNMPNLFFLKSFNFIFELISPKLILNLRYYIKFRRLLDLSDPVLFYDKIFYNSLYSDTSRWTELADKYKVRKYVEEICGSGFCPKLLGIYHSSREIPFDVLPNQFVLKTNNGCASNIIVKDKNIINKKEICRKLDYWLAFPYGKITGQKHYSKIIPVIIAEEMLIQDRDVESPLIDYKFYCFHGVPSFCMVMSDRKFNTHEVKLMMYDMKWNPKPKFFNGTKVLKEVEKPKCLEELKKMAEKLSKGFPFVRVDLYSINDHPVFGEMTFMPGMDIGLTLEKQKELGDLI